MMQHNTDHAAADVCAAVAPFMARTPDQIKGVAIVILDENGKVAIGGNAEIEVLGVLLIEAISQIAENVAIDLAVDSVKIPDDVSDLL